MGGITIPWNQHERSQLANQLNSVCGNRKLIYSVMPVVSWLAPIVAIATGDETACSWHVHVAPCVSRSKLPFRTRNDNKNVFQIYQNCPLKNVIICQHHMLFQELMCLCSIFEPRLMKFFGLVGQNQWFLISLVLSLQYLGQISN